MFHKCTASSLGAQAYCVLQERVEFCAPRGMEKWTPRFWKLEVRRVLKAQITLLAAAVAV